MAVASENFAFILYGKALSAPIFSLSSLHKAPISGAEDFFFAPLVVEARFVEGAFAFFSTGSLKVFDAPQTSHFTLALVGEVCATTVK